MLRSVTCAALALAAAPAWCGDFAPGSSAGALARSFALPALGAPQVLPSNRGETRLTLDVANEYVGEGDCNTECMILDGETSRLRLSHRRGLGGGWDAAVELALLHRGGGMLDGFIQDWHGWFGLPNGGREFAPNGGYFYYYRRDGQPRLDEREGGTDFGDTQLTVGRALGASTALRAMAKLPTGDSSAPGGGNAGAALWLEQGFGGAGGWRGYAALGGSFNERGDVLPDQQNTGIVFGGIGLAVPLTRRLTATAQLNAHGPLYDDSPLDLNSLTRPGAPLTLGLRLRTGARGSIELGFQEDPAVNASPDFALYLMWERR